MMIDTPRPARVRVSDRVVNDLRNFIAREELQPGAKFPPERVLVDEFAVGRSSLREAIRVLATLGVLEVRHGDGIYVRSPTVPTPAPTTTNSTGDGSLLAGGNRSSGSETLRHLIEARIGVEMAAATAVAERGSTRDFDVLEELLDRHARALRQDQRWEPLEFERTLVGLSGNVLLVDFETALASQWARFWQGLIIDLARYQEWVAEHRAVLASIRTHNISQLQRLFLVHINVDRLEQEHDALRPLTTTQGSHRAEGNVLPLG